MEQKGMAVHRRQAVLTVLTQCTWGMIWLALSKGRCCVG
jgi:hypothetical protein